MTSYQPALSESDRRILSLWFPRLAAEQILRGERGLVDAPLAVVRQSGNMRVISSLSEVASALGVQLGQPLAEAHALCPDLQTRVADPLREAAFLSVLRRWAGKFSPWVAEEPPEGLMIDLTGCAHLFGGEENLLLQIENDCAALQLTVRAGIADTAGAAWALARFAGQGAGGGRNGDAIDQEARATRSRAGKRRHWTKGGAAPLPRLRGMPETRIAKHGQLHEALGDLPVAALRLEGQVVAELNRLGLRRIREIYGTPRATLARRFGSPLTRRLDQALGMEPEPIMPAEPEVHYAVRMSLPDPIGLEADILAGLDRMLPVLCTKLEENGRGARRVRLEMALAEGHSQSIEIGLARPGADPHRIRPLFKMKLGEVEAGFGIDMLRLVAHVTEPLKAHQMTGGAIAARDATARQSFDTGLEDLMGRIGARVGLEAITREHPGQSHVPEKTGVVFAAAWSEPVYDWPAPPCPRPLTLFRPEPVHAEGAFHLPEKFRWRGRDFATLGGIGPERVAPEWWLDEADWRSGIRDYWQVETETGERLWLFYAHGAAISDGWYCHGDFL